MKPCSKNRKKIAWLALNALDAVQERELRAHFESCPACRAYWKQLSALTGQLSSAQQLGPLKTSDQFHQQVVRAVHNARHESIHGWFRLWPSFSWRLALPIAGVVMVLAAVLSSDSWHPQTPRKVSVASPSRTAVPVELEPTVFNYQMMANASLDKLDDVLTSQGSRNPPSGSSFLGPDLAGSPNME